MSPAKAAKTAQTDAPTAGASPPSAGGGKPKAATPRPDGPPAPAVQMQAQMPADVPTASAAPPVPVLPSEAEATRYGEEKTESLLRAVVAYNKHHVQRVIQEDNRWFKGWPDVPPLQIGPLNIRKPDSKDDLLTYVAPWRRTEAMVAFEGTGTYKGGGNVFWLDPFVDRCGASTLAASKPATIAGDPPLYSTVLEEHDEDPGRRPRKRKRNPFRFQRSRNANRP